MALTRREFLSSYVPAALLARELPIPVPMRDRGDYSFIVLGDIHFDGTSTSTYHSSYVKPSDPEKAQGYLDEFSRNAKMWADRLPRLLKSAASQARSDTAFVLQMGDLVQGDCNSDAVHRRMAMDAFDTVKDAFGRKLPLYVTCGNHDIRQNGGSLTTQAGPAYYAYMSRRLAAEEGLAIAESAKLNYSFMRGPDLFVFANFNLAASTELDFVRKAFAAHPEARYRFLITHGPPIPSDTSNWYWGLCNSKTDSDSAQAPRRELLSLLLANDVIVLSGHVHTTELTEIATDAGRVTQVIASSMFTSEVMATKAPTRTEPSQYGVAQTTALGKAVLGEYRPAVTRYWRGPTAGHMRVDVTSRGVTVRFCGGDAKSPREIWRIR